MWPSHASVRISLGFRAYSIGSTDYSFSEHYEWVGQTTHQPANQCRRSSHWHCGRRQVGHGTSDLSGVKLKDTKKKYEACSVCVPLGLVVGMGGGIGKWRIWSLRETCQNLVLSRSRHSRDGAATKCLTEDCHDLRSEGHGHRWRANGAFAMSLRNNPRIKWSLSVTLLFTTEIGDGFPKIPAAGQGRGLKFGMGDEKSNVGSLVYLRLLGRRWFPLYLHLLVT